MTLLQVLGFSTVVGILVVLIALVGYSLGLSRRVILQRESHFRGYHEAMLQIAHELEQIARLRIAERDHKGAVVAREMVCVCEAYARDVRREFTTTIPTHGGSAPGV